MFADDRSEKSKFNILQFAHQQLGVSYHGVQCSRLEEFTACWNLLQQICGPKVRGWELHATLLVEGCKIQSELDTVGCHWQDMLLPHYIQASRLTVWPMVSQCLQDPMYLESSYYSLTFNMFNSVMDDLNTVISLLQPGGGGNFQEMWFPSCQPTEIIASQAPLSTTGCCQVRGFIIQCYDTTLTRSTFSMQCPKMAVRLIVVIPDLCMRTCCLTCFKQK